MSDWLWPSGTSRVDLGARPREGRIVAVSTEGVTFVLPGFSERLSFGPAPYIRVSATGAASAGTEHTHPIPGPEVGNRCLVVFADGDRSRPWVLGWWS